LQKREAGLVEVHCIHFKGIWIRRSDRHVA